MHAATHSQRLPVKNDHLSIDRHLIHIHKIAILMQMSNDHVACLSGFGQIQSTTTKSSSKKKSLTHMTVELKDLYIYMVSLCEKSPDGTIEI